MSANPVLPEVTPEDSGRGGIHLKTGVLETFAQNVARNIVQSFLIQVEMVEPETDLEVSEFNQAQEVFAEALASELLDVALTEASRGPNTEDPHRSASGGANMEGGQGHLPVRHLSGSGRDLLLMDPGREIQTSKNVQPCHPFLSQSGLPVVGSLDYPDAPPTTPLLPELERSRCSFARKLKGGLAKVFLPSPPPPTPREEDGYSDSRAIDRGVELMEHLMRSLPTDDLTGAHEEGPHPGAKVEAFAETLSWDVINWVLRTKEQRGDDRDLHLLAHQLAESVIISSLREARMLV